MKDSSDSLVTLATKHRVLDRMPVGTQFGRYVILDLQGAGGMGVVYSAYDPKLDRRVALKLLRPSAADATDAGARLLREAQALAKLKHPNVVAVHDSGILGDVVFVEMELVDGVTLDVWSKDRPWREILDAYLQAARALAAVHGVGLIHRDFKPSNAIVDSEGRVRVLDFGVARASADSEGDDDAKGGATAPTPAPPSTRSEDLVRASKAPVSVVPQTEWGKATGTPAFMPPEQWRGHAIDARADQYAFASSLFKEFYGVLPFGQPNPTMMISAWNRGAVAPRPAGSRVPAYVYRALVRALSFASIDRYPKMDDLIEALDRDPAAAPRRRVMAVVALVVLFLGVAGGYRYVRAREAGVCAASSEKLAGAWDEAKMRRVHEAIGKSGQPSAEDVWTRTKRLLDDYAAAWVTMRTDSCLETRRATRHVEDAALGARLVCLDWRLRELHALTDLLATDSDLGHGTINAATGLVPVADCANPAMRDNVRPYEDPAVRARVEVVRTKLAEADARVLAGRPKAAEPIATLAVEEARKTNVRAAIGLALLTLGHVQHEDGNYKAAATTLEEAVWAAEAARDDATLVSATTELAMVTGFRLRDKPVGARWERHAMAALDRLGTPDALGAELDYVRSGLTSDYKESLVLAERGLSRALRAHGPRHRNVARAEHGVANALFYLKRYDEAVARFERERELLEHLLGPTHPDCAKIFHNEAIVQRRRGNVPEAIALYRRALAIEETALGSDHPNVALALHNMGLALVEMGQFEQAKASFERALVIRQKVYGEEHALCAGSWNSIGDAEEHMKNYADARVHYARSAQMYEAVGGATNTSMCVPLHGLASISLLENRPKEGLVFAERALAVRVKKLGKDHADTAGDVTWVARCHIAAGDAARAVPMLERAAALLVEKDKPATLAELEFVLARALRETSGSPTRARALATKAAAHFEKAGVGGHDELVEIRAWMAANERWLASAPSD